MKFTFFVLLIALPSYMAQLFRLCRKATPVDLEIPENTFVKPGPRASKDEWYQSLNWTAVPNGPVTLSTQLWKKAYRWDSSGTKDMDLFSDDEEGVAMHVRYALGIRRFSDIQLGEVITDPLLFKPRPCTVLYTRRDWPSSQEYQIGIVVNTKHNQQVLLNGYLKFPSS